MIRLTKARLTASLFAVAAAYGQSLPPFYGVQKEPFLGERLEMRHQYFEIQVTVVGTSERLEEVESYILRNLRSLRDVRIVTNRPFVHLRIHVADFHRTPGRAAGLAMATVITYPWLDSAIDHLVGPERKGDLANLSSRHTLRSADNYEAASIITVDGGSLLAACEKLITSFDIKYLKPSREAWTETFQSGR